MRLRGASQIMMFSIFLAGFIFVSATAAPPSPAPSVTPSLSSPMSDRVVVASSVLLYISFIMAAFASVAAMILMEWLRSIEGENLEFITAALSTNKAILKLCPEIAFGSITLLVGVLNLQVHVYLSREAAVIVNVVCFAGALAAGWLLYHFTIRRQTFVKPDGTIAMRNLYHHPTHHKSMRKKK